MLNILHHAGQLPTTKNYPAPNVSIAKVEKRRAERQRERFLLKKVPKGRKSLWFCGTEVGGRL